LSAQETKGYFKLVSAPHQGWKKKGKERKTFSLLRRPPPPSRLTTASPTSPRLLLIINAHLWGVKRTSSSPPHSCSSTLSFVKAPRFWEVIYPIAFASFSLVDLLRRVAASSSTLAPSPSTLKESVG